MWIKQACAQCGQVYEGGVPDGTSLEGLTCDDCQGVTRPPNPYAWRAPPPPAPGCCDCGAASVPTEQGQPPRCAACYGAFDTRRLALWYQLAQLFRGFWHGRAPNRGTVTWALADHYATRGGFSRLYRATDRELLQIDQIGRKSVRALRQHWPQCDDWVEHVEMLAGVT